MEKKVYIYPNTEVTQLKGMRIMGLDESSFGKSNLAPAAPQPTDMPVF